MKPDFADLLPNLRARRPPISTRRTGFNSWRTTVRNYDGSWTEYGSLVGAPIETGDSAQRRGR